MPSSHFMVYSAAFITASILLASCGRKEVDPVLEASQSAKAHPRQAPTTEQRRITAERMRPILVQANQPIRFQGRICDTTDHPLAGVRVAFTVNRAGRVDDSAMIHEDKVSAVLESDASGAFLISEHTGVSLTIHELRKNDYTTARSDHWSFLVEEMNAEKAGKIETFRMLRQGEVIPRTDRARKSSASTSAPQSQRQSKVKYVTNPAHSIRSQTLARSPTSDTSAVITGNPGGASSLPSQQVQGAGTMPNQPPSVVRPTENPKPTRNQREYVMIEVTDDGARISKFPAGDADSWSWKVSKAGDAMKAGGQEPVVVPNNSSLEIQVSRQDNPVAIATLLVFPAWFDQAAEKQKALLSFQTGDKVLLTVEESDNLQAGWVPTPLVESGGRQYAKLPRFPKRYYRIKIAPPAP